MSNCYSDFLQKSGLYDSIAINESNINDLIDLIGGKIRLSEYCVECKEMRVFTMEPISFSYGINGDISQMCSLADALSNLQNTWKRKNTYGVGQVVKYNEWYWTNWQTERATRIMVFSFVCTMDNTHHLDYVVRTNDSLMVKIGQFPSVADLSFPTLIEFKKDIDEQSMKEFRRAIGLHAQGIGIGSYVYLRRIFERILEMAKQEAQADSSLDLSKYNSMRVSERIQLLKEYLPDMISSNPAIYSIVSKGIHELSEDECIKFFPILKESISMILSQWAQKRKEKEAKKKLEESISKIATELSQ